MIKVEFRDVIKTTIVIELHSSTKFTEYSISLQIWLY